MAKFKEMIKLDSLTQAEVLLKQALKNQDMHKKALHIITTAMDRIMKSNSENCLRETNVELFLSAMNSELMTEEPDMAI